MLDSSREAPPRRSLLAGLLDRPARLIAVGIALFVIGFQFWISPSNPPGFIRDEASFSYNAYTIGHHLRDQDGGFLPLYFVSYHDYKSPLFVYVLAAVFRVTGPSREVARGVAAACVLAAVLLVGLLAWRRSRSLAVTVGAAALVGLMPWLFELGRAAYDTATLPLTVALVLVATEWGYRSQRNALVRALPVGLALGAVLYCYAGGRLLAPLLAVALVVFAGRARWRWLLASWGVFALSVVPLAVYSQEHPGALTARYQATTFIHGGMSFWTIAGDLASHYVHDLNLWYWIVSGDPKPYIHSGAGQLYAAVVVLALLGIGVIVMRRRGDLWWRYALAALLLAPIPAALTEDRFNALRMAAFPLVLVVVAIPGLEVLLAAARNRWLARALAVAVVLGVVVQFGQFLNAYTVNGPHRTELFEAGVPVLLQHAFAGGRTVYVDHDDRYAQTHALWYAVSHGLGRARVSILPDGGIPPNGSMVFGRLQPCDYVCPHVAESYDYWIATAAGPKR
jgi:4-amino-4-deoxy-L-arabinose transferase-like glycosyltransferase